MAISMQSEVISRSCASTVFRRCKAKCRAVKAPNPMALGEAPCCSSSSAQPFELDRAAAMRRSLSTVCE